MARPKCVLRLLLAPLPNRVGAAVCGHVNVVRAWSVVGIGFGLAVSFGFAKVMASFGRTAYSIVTRPWYFVVVARFSFGLDRNGMTVRSKLLLKIVLSGSRSRICLKLIS